MLADPEAVSGFLKISNYLQNLSLMLLWLVISDRTTHWQPLPYDVCWLISTAWSANMDAGIGCGCIYLSPKWSADHRHSNHCSCAGTKSHAFTNAPPETHDHSYPRGLSKTFLWLLLFTVPGTTLGGTYNIGLGSVPMDTKCSIFSKVSNLDSRKLNLRIQLFFTTWGVQEYWIENVENAENKKGFIFWVSSVFFNSTFFKQFFWKFACSYETPPILRPKNFPCRKYPLLNRITLQVSEWQKALLT